MLLKKKITLYIVSLDFNYFYLLIFWKSRVSKINLKSCKFLFLICISCPFNNFWLTDVPCFGSFHVEKIHSQFKKLTLAQISLDLVNLVQKQSILIQIINNAAITLNQHKCKWVRTSKFFKKIFNCKSIHVKNWGIICLFIKFNVVHIFLMTSSSLYLCSYQQADICQRHIAIACNSWDVPTYV